MFAFRSVPYNVPPVLLTLLVLLLYPSFSAGQSSSTVNSASEKLPAEYRFWGDANLHLNSIPPVSADPLKNPYRESLGANYLLRTHRNENQSTNINWTGFTVISAGIAGFYTGLFLREQNRRWSPTKVPFYFNSRLQGRGMDKFGHFYATKTQASFISNLYDFSSVSRNTSALLGAGIALSVQSLIEIKDGRVSSGGFDAYDETANLLGAGWFFAREKVDFLQRFDVRWFYYPSGDKDLLEANTRFNEDYSGHSYWLSMRTHDLFPKFWPKFIVPAAGISLNDWAGEDAQTEYFSYHLSINPDFNYILPQGTRVGRFLTDILNGFYIPAPALEVYPDFGFKLVFYGQ